ncbi:MAG: hypothetical protein KY476_16995, partial [Planctomycetes bacterium]|nr:hypothetical protein [Planctomycetota bacterium]
TAAALKDHLTNFYDRLGRRPRRNRRRGWLVRRLATATAALGLSAMLWLLLASPVEPEQRVMTVPIVYRGLPEGWGIDDPAPHEARLSLFGTRRAFERLPPGKPPTVAIDLNRAVLGARTVKLSERGIQGLPEDLEVLSIEPETARVRVYRSRQVRVPVRLVTEGIPPAGLEVIGQETEPSQVTARFRDRGAQTFSAIPTRPIDLEGLTESTTLPVRLDPPADVEIVEPASGSVTATIRLAPRQEARANDAGTRR